MNILEKNTIKDFDLNAKEINFIDIKNFKLNDKSKGDVSNSIITKILRHETKKDCGIYNYILNIETGNGTENIPVIFKVKLPDKYCIDVVGLLFKTLGNESLSRLFQDNKEIAGFCDTHVHETGFYSTAKKSVLKHCPQIYDVEINEKDQDFLIVMEDLSNDCYFDTKECPISWNDKRIKAALNAISDVHATYINKFNEISKSMHLRKIDDDLINFKTAGAFLKELTYHNAKSFSNFINKDVLALCDDFINNLSENVGKMQSFPMTLSHNDFNNRNVCFRKGRHEDKFIIYDWELATYQNPQYDAIEFLLSVLDEESPKEEFYSYISFYKSLLEKKTSQIFNDDEFMDLVYINAQKLAFTRFNMHLLVNNAYDLGHIMKSYNNFVKIFVPTSNN